MPCLCPLPHKNISLPPISLPPLFSSCLHPPLQNKQGRRLTDKGFFAFSFSFGFLPACLPFFYVYYFILIRSFVSSLDRRAFLYFYFLFVSLPPHCFLHVQGLVSFSSGWIPPVPSLHSIQLGGLPHTSLWGACTFLLSLPAHLCLCHTSPSPPPFFSTAVACLLPALHAPSHILGLFTCLHTWVVPTPLSPYLLLPSSCCYTVCTFSS